MAFARHPSQPPPLDTTSFVRRLREIAAKVGLGPFDAYADNRLPKFHRWLRSELEYDGNGLRDVVSANAYALDDLKGDFDQHRVSDNERHQALAKRVAALEGQQTNAPFPGSG